MTKEEARQKAANNFKSGLNCTQSVVSVFAEQLGYDKDQIMSLCEPFGGGMCRMREVCGTVSGMLMCLGMYNKKAHPVESDPSDKENFSLAKIKAHKDQTYKDGQALAEKFRQANGSIVCAELLGLKKRQPDIPVSEARTEEYYKKRPCAELCGLAAYIFQEFLDEQTDTTEGTK